MKLANEKSVQINDGEINIREKENIGVKSYYPLNQIYFYLTGGCNLACRHCWLSPKLQDENITYPSLSIELFKSILEQGKTLGIKAIKLTGGEPMMHPQISEILKTIKDQEMTLSVETNGVLCTQGIARELASCKSPFVSVSLDSADAATHEWIRGIKGCFEAALKGIRNILNKGVNTQIIFTIQKRNKNKLREMVRLVESLGARSIKFNIVQPTGRGAKLTNDGETLTLQEILELNKFVNNTLSHSTKLKLYFDIPAAFRPLSKMFGEKGDGCSTCSILDIIGVLPDGNYALCGIGTHIPELVFGNASFDKLADTWKNNETLRKLREGIPFLFEGVCGRCHMKRICNASCIAQNYYRTKSLWKPYWLCDEAYKKGIFPETRLIPEFNL